MSYALVIFDFDGTLADSARWFHDNINAVARRYRFRQIGPDDVEALRAQDTASIIRHLGVPRWKLPFIAAHMRKLMARDLDQITLFPGVVAMLHELRATGVHLAIVSSNAQDNVARVLGVETAAIIDQFGCGTAMAGKARKFRRVLRQTGVAADEAIAIGDEVRDIEAARAVGIASGAVAWGYAAAEFLVARGPDVLFERVEDIAPSVLRGQASGEGNAPIGPLTRSGARR